MATTPILGITQVTASQNSKEVTINDAIIALEAAANAKLDVDFTSSTSVLLSNTQATRNFIFVAKNATANSILRFPNTVNGNNLNRVFAVRNDSGYQITVKFTSGAGSTVIIPDGATRLIDAMDGLDMIVAAEPATAVTFLDLTDTPGSYTGQTGKFLSVNVAENALEFVTAATFPSFTGNAGKYLVVNGTATGVEWVPLTLVTTFLGLSDTPSSFTGQGNKLVAVNSGATALQFIDVPDIEAVEYVTASRWRIRITEPGLEDQVAFGEIEWLDLDGINLVGGGTASASSEAVGKEAEFAFDGDTSAGNGWMSELAFDIEEWIEYEFAAGVEPRNVRIYPINGFPDYSPARIIIERHDGIDWVAAGERIPETWVSEESQTFKVNGVPFSSVVDAPLDGQLYGRKDGDWEVAYPPIAGNGEKVLAVNSGATATEWIDPPSGDAEYPSFTDNAGKVLAVNDTEDGVEWVSSDYLNGTAADFDARASTGSASAYAGGIWFGNLITFEAAGFIDSVVYSLNTAETGINAHPVIYANNAGAAGALLAEGPTVNDGGVGDNVLALSAPLAVAAGDVLWVGCYQANTGSIDATKTAGDVSKYFIDTLPPNDPGGALTSWSERLRIFARGRELAPIVAPPSTVQAEAGNYTLAPSDMGNYIRLTSASTKTISIDLESTTALPINGEWNFRNVGAGDATITPVIGVTVHPPAEGTLVVPQGGTVTLKRVAADEFDLLGQTVAA